MSATDLLKIRTSAILPLKKVFTCGQNPTIIGSELFCDFNLLSILNGLFSLTPF